MSRNSTKAFGGLRRWIALAAFLAPVVLAAPQAWASACVQDTLAAYVALGSAGCEIGDKIFSDFLYSSSASGVGASAIPADGVTVVPINAVDEGFSFEAAWQVGTGQTQDSLIHFTVSLIDGSPALIEDAAAALLASGATGSGLVTVAEGGCGPVPCTTEQWANFIFKAGSGTSQVEDHVFFTPIGSIRVTKDIGLSGGTTADSIAALSQVTDTFSQTSAPEPASLALLGTALLGLGLVRRRRNRP